MTKNDAGYVSSLIPKTSTMGSNLSRMSLPAFRIGAVSIQIVLNLRKNRLESCLGTSWHNSFGGRQTICFIP